MSKSEFYNSVEIYVQTTRRQLKKRINQDFYDKVYFPSLDWLLLSQGLRIRFVLTYSTRRHCEVITDGSNHVIVYDQYLGQTFNMLNRLLLRKRKEKLSSIYFHKLLAEQL